MNRPPPFQPFGIAHLTVIALTLVLPFLLAALARKYQRAERPIAALLSLLLVANYLAYISFVRELSGATWKQLLPLQLCDWAMVVVIVALWTCRRSWSETAYFWGIGGTVQAVLTPNLIYGFPDLRFFSFFVSHCAIIVGVVFLMLVHRLRPHASSVVRVFLWTEVYFLVTLAADAYTGFNYGFLLHKPEAKSLLSLLSDQRPLYLAQMHLLALAFLVLLYLPFWIADACKGKIAGERAQSRLRQLINFY